MKALWFGTLLFFVNLAYGQDIHFSQFYHAPSVINPAFTGFFDGDIRIHANHRTQWNSISPGVPFRTFGFFTDAANLSGKPIHGGVAVYSDKTGDSRFSTLTFDLTAATGKYLDTDSTHKISGGVLLGISQRSINYDDVRWGSQYNGIYFDPQQSSGEGFPAEGYAFMNSAAGFVYSWESREKFSFTTGVALYHLIKPKQSFYNDRTIRLDRRLTTTLIGNYRLSDVGIISPRINLMVQGKYHELVIGSLYRHSLQTLENDVALTGGIFARTRDAGFIVIGIDYENIRGAISYDLNFSSLAAASNNRGGLELSFVYIFRKFRPEKCIIHGCPPYI